MIEHDCKGEYCKEGGMQEHLVEHDALLIEEIRQIKNQNDSSSIDLSINYDYQNHHVTVLKLRKFRDNKTIDSQLVNKLLKKVRHFEHLRRLIIEYAQFTSIPASIGNLVNLELLTIACAQLTSLPDSIGNLVNLRRLNIGSEQLTSLPDSISNLVNLRRLNIYNSRLTSLPDSIGNLVKLEELNIYNSRLTSLPDSIGNLVKLRELNIKHSRLTSLPDSIGNLVKLIELDLEDNEFSSIPESILKIEGLFHLSLVDNNITYEEIPEYIKSIHRLGITTGHRCVRCFEIGCDWPDICDEVDEWGDKIINDDDE